MNLPGPGNGVIWKEYRNMTPTFHLTPIEKPDFSPFLIHMTGKNSLVSILKGENSPDDVEIKEANGYLKAIKPTFEGQGAIYNSEVVCFTEAPVFALVFFRYRSYRRWSGDQQFGIGFSKSDLIKLRNVRPVIYLDTNTNSEILKLSNQVIDGKVKVVNDEGELLDYKRLFEKIKPLLFPLLENTSYQGFMWEREWRCPDNKGLIFPHDAIKVICCPSEERDEIKEILSNHVENVEIVESWREYDDVTNYLKRRKVETNAKALSKIKEIKNLATLNQLKVQNEQTINMLTSHYGIFKETVDGLEKGNIQQLIGDMKKKSVEIIEQIKSVTEENKVKEEQAKAKK